MTLLGRYVTRINVPEECCWWSERLRRCAANSDLTTFAEAHHIVSAFAYLDEVYGPTWEHIWHEDVLGESIYGTASIEADGLNDDMERHPCNYHPS